MRLPLITSVLTLALAAPAFAADYNGTVGASSPTFAWDGGPGSSLGANTPVLGGVSVGNFAGCFDGIADCEEALIKVETAGKLTVTTDSADDENDTVDLYLWPADAEGTYDDGGDDLGEGGGAQTTGDEKIEVQVSPGYYVAQIKFFLADEDTYKGSAVLSGFVAPPAAPAGAAPSPGSPAPSSTPAPGSPSQPAPQNQPASQPAPEPAAKKKKKTSKRAACTKKAKKIKNKKKRAKAMKRCKKMKG